MGATRSRSHQTIGLPPLPPSRTIPCSCLPHLFHPVHTASTGLWFSVRDACLRHSAGGRIVICKRTGTKSAPAAVFFLFLHHAPGSVALCRPGRAGPGRLCLPAGDPLQNGGPGRRCVDHVRGGPPQQRALLPPNPAPLTQPPGRPALSLLHVHGRRRRGRRPPAAAVPAGQPEAAHAAAVEGGRHDGGRLCAVQHGKTRRGRKKKKKNARARRFPLTFFLTPFCPP